jgi:hypothetical protein
MNPMESFGSENFNSQCSADILVGDRFMVCNGFREKMNFFWFPKATHTFCAPIRGEVEGEASVLPSAGSTASRTPQAKTKSKVKYRKSSNPSTINSQQLPMCEPKLRHSCTLSKSQS